MALEVTLVSSTLEVDAQYDAGNPVSAELNISGEASRITTSINPLASWATLSLDINLTTLTGSITVIRCDEYTDVSSVREQLFTITITPYHIEIDPNTHQQVEIQDPQSILELTIIQDPALMVPQSEELSPEDMAAMAGQSINELRISLAGSQSAQLVKSIVSGASTSIITIPDSLKNQIVAKIAGFSTQMSNIDLTRNSVLNSVATKTTKLTRLQQQLANEQAKGSKGRPDKIQAEIDEVSAEISQLNQKASNLQQQSSNYVNDALNTLQGSDMLNRIESEISNFTNQCGAIAKAIPELVQNTITSVFEPMGSVATCAVGPVVTATNPLQILGTLKRLGVNAKTLTSYIQSALGSATYLGLPEKMIQPLATLGALLGVIG